MITTARPPAPAAVPSHHAAAATPARTSLPRIAGTAGAVVPGLFYLTIAVLGQITPRYDAISRYASELSLGRYGWAMITGFLLTGLAILGVAAAMRQAAGRARAGRLAAVMTGLAGAAFLAAGAFTTDPHGQVKTAHGAVHFAAAVIIFLVAVPAAALATWRWLRGSRRWLARYSAATAIATPLLFIATIASGPYLGLTERIVIGVVLGWVTVLATTLRTGQIPAPRHIPAARQ